MNNNITNFFYSIPKEINIYLICTNAHYVTPHMYVYFCTPGSIYGILMSQFMVITPHCQCIRWTLTFSGYVLNNLWFLFMSLLLNKVLTYFGTFGYLTTNSNNNS